MGRRRKPKTILGMLFGIGTGTVKTAGWMVKSYCPYNSKGAKVNRAKKWF